MSRPVTGSPEPNFARCSEQMRPYSAHVVMRTIQDRSRGSERQAEWSPLAQRSPSAHAAVLAARNADLRHLPKVEHFVNLIVGEHVLALHEIANQHTFLHRLLAQLG